MSIVFVLFAVRDVRADDPLARVRKAVQKSTLDQKGTHPFHLKATVGPSMARDKDSGRFGEVEIWWKAPGEYRREVKSAEFHQIQIVSRDHTWEKNEGEYFPNWLREVAEAIVRPLPAESDAMRGIQPDKARTMFGSVYLNWEKSVPVNLQPGKEVVALTDASDLLFYDGGLAWGALFKDYADFHGRTVARAVSSGSPEVMARIFLEDLPKVAPDWFEAKDAGPGSEPINTIAVDNSDIVPDLEAPAPPPVWPTTKTRLTGVVWTVLVLDRTGRIREPFTTISDNPEINETAHAYFASLHFKPTVRDGIPVQVVRRIAIPFELHRPEGYVESGTGH